MSFDLPTAENPAVIVHGDCVEVLRELPAGCVDAVVTDPPYGLGKRWSRKSHGSNGASRLWTGVQPIWDKEVPQEEINAAVAFSPRWAVWGAYKATMPPGTGLLVWDKMQKTNRSEGESALTNFVNGVRFFRMSRIDAYVNKAEIRKEHPCEKPIQLMRWCLSFLPKGSVILDPFAGSFSTGVAAVQCGHRFIGIEKEAAYVEIGRKRLASVERDMFAGVA